MPENKRPSLSPVRPLLGWLMVLAGAVLPVHGMAFDLQGHRGTRGLMPENTLPAFRKALSLGVTTLETDLAVTRDGTLVLSHERTLNPDITRGPDGKWLVKAGPPISSLTLDDIKRYDVGRIRPGTSYARLFSTQTPVDGAGIPTLAELFALARSSDMAPRLNIETKISPLRPSETPDPETFAKLVVDSVRASGMLERVTIQSFDWRTLLIAKRLEPKVATACLTSQSPTMDTIGGSGGVLSPWLAGLDPERHGNSVPRLAKAAGCTFWSPNFASLTRKAVDEAHALGLKVLPWSVNEIADIERIIDLGVDGLITDYPDRAMKVITARGMALR